MEPLRREGMSSSSLFFSLPGNPSSAGLAVARHSKTCEEANCEPARRFSIILY